MSDPETRPSREDLRENPGDMWDNMEPTQKFEGQVAEAKTPNSYQMTIAEGFRGNGSEIDTEKWHQWFYEKDKETNKDETYFNKVENAVGYWNSLSQDEREHFLTTGEYSDKITGNLISLLTSARIIDFVEPAPVETVPPAPVVPPTPVVPPSIEPLPSVETPSAPTPEPFVAPEPIIDAPEPVEQPAPIEQPEPVIETPAPIEQPAPVEMPMPVEQPEPVQNVSRPGNAVIKPEERFTSVPPVENIITDKKKPGFFKRFVNRFHKETPEAKEVKEDDELQVLFRTEFASLTPEQQRETTEKVKESRKKLINIAKNGAIALVTLLLLMNPIEKEKVPGRVSGLQLIKNENYIGETGDEDQTEDTEDELPPAPSFEEEESSTEEGSDQETTTEESEDEEDGETAEAEERTIEKVVPVQDLDLGETVKLPGGIELHYTSDVHDKNYSIHATTVEGEEYTMNRIAIWNEDGTQLIGTYHLPNGDAGKVSELIDKTRQEKGISEDTPLTLFYHYNQNGTELGWTDADTAIATRSERDSMPKPEPKDPTKYPGIVDPGIYPTPTPTPPEPEPPLRDPSPVDNSQHEYLITSFFEGEITNNKDKSVAIRTEKGEETIIPIRDENGEPLASGTRVLGDDGKPYEVYEIKEAESKYKINGLRLGHDLAVIGTGVAVALMLNRKKREGEGETSEESATTTTAAETSGEQEEQRIILDLNADQLRKTTSLFSAFAGNRAGAIADQFAKESGISAKQIAERTNNPSEDSIYANMSRAERTVACVLLSNQHEPTSIDRLTHLLDTDYNDFIGRIGIDEKALAAARKPEENPAESPAETNPEEAQ